MLGTKTARERDGLGEIARAIATREGLGEGLATKTFEGLGDAEAPEQVRVSEYEPLEDEYPSNRMK
jgi:hypothetical protein